jgi:hypothetical protein
MAASLVSEDWQQFVFQHFYGNFKVVYMSSSFRLLTLGSLDLSQAEK